MRIDRMLAIVVLLLNRKSITAKELADRFEVSPRTVYRDIDAINEAGIPVVSSQGVGGGYSIMENYRLNHQFLSLENSRTIISALKGVNTALQDREVELTMEKIRSLVPLDKTPELDRQMDHFVIDYLPWGFGSLMQKRIQEINRAISESKQLKIEYFNLKGEKSFREIEPMTLLFKGYNWYLFGYCLLKKDGRVFRLSRIKELETQNKSFTRRNITFTDFTLQKESAQTLVNLKLKFDSKVKLRVQEFFYLENISEEPDGSLLVNVSFPEDNWLYSMILSYGEYVEVISPKRVRQAVLDSAKKVQSIYQT